MHIANYLLSTIEASTILGYFVIFLIFFLESIAFVGLFIPGTIFLVLIGFLAANDSLDIYMALSLIFAAVMAGDAISFYFGRAGKFFFREENTIFKLKYLEKGKNFFQRHGNKSVLVGRFIGPMRPLISFIAGLFKMGKKRFYVFNAISAIIWIVFYFVMGYFFGQAWQMIKFWSGKIGVSLFFLFTFLLLIYFLKNFFVKQGRPLLFFIRSVFISVKNAIAANSEVKKLVSRYPLFFSWLGNRLNKNNFFGLPLTFLSLVFVYVFFLLIGVIEDIITSDIIVSVDLRVENLIAAFRHLILIKAFLWITLLGKSVIILSFMIAVSFLFWLWRKRAYMAPLWVAVGGASFLVFLGKIAFHRPRPLEALYFENTFSFPSGHAALATAFFGFLVYFGWRNVKKWKTKLNILFSGIAILILVGFSRLYLGVHYLSDVWGGYLLGLLWVIIGISFSEIIFPPTFPHTPQESGGGNSKEQEEKRSIRPALLYIKIISFAVILAELIFFIGFGINYQPERIAPQRAVPETVSGVLDIFSKYKLPKYSENLTGGRQEPLSFIIIAADGARLAEIFKKADWHAADQISFYSLYKVIKSAVLNLNYSAAPMTPSFWNAEVHNFGFENSAKIKSLKERHQVKFWDSNFKDGDGRKIYVGTASLDIRSKWGIVHKISPDINTEREYVFSELSKTDLVEKYGKDKFMDSTAEENFVNSQFFTDGEAYVVYLK
ncbi:LssY C-terminal domain-containing protein [Candidatus Falkowbacteria bacterium]|nr:LssY C-terminal domain-containing protein [Candidatus Falkowbacteria bacterium]